MVALPISFEDNRRPRGQSKLLLGNGSYGQVYRATHSTIGQVAVKEVLMNDEGIEQSTLREIAVLQFARKHPHIVQLLEVQKPDDQRLWMILNCAHGTLQNYLSLRHENLLSPFVTDPVVHHAGQRQSPRPSFPENLTQWHADHSALPSLLFQINRALLFLHEHTVLHRDIKPDNILFTVIAAPQETRGFVLQAQLCDFGLSRFLHCPATDALSHFVVTVPYRAPELFDLDVATDHLGKPSEGDYDAAVDMWSYGCIFYEALSGGCRLFPVVEADQMAAELHLAFDRVTGSPLAPLENRFHNLTTAYPAAFTTLPLLRGLLAYHPPHRWTAYQVTHHPWWHPVQREIRQYWPLPPSPVKNPLATTHVISHVHPAPPIMTPPHIRTPLSQALQPYQSCHPPLHQQPLPALLWYFRRKAIRWMIEIVFQNNPCVMTRQCALLLLDRYCAITTEAFTEFPALLGATLMIASKLHDYAPYSRHAIMRLLRPYWDIPSPTVFEVQLLAYEWSVLTTLKWRLFEINLGYFFYGDDLKIPPPASLPTLNELTAMCRDPRIMSTYAPEQLYDHLRQWVMPNNVIRVLLQEPYRPFLQIRSRN